MNNYAIFSGFFSRPDHGAEWFHHLWFDNLMKYAAPQRVFIISSGNCSVPGARGEWITLSGDLGCCGHVLDRKKKVYCPAAVAGWMAGLWLAYLNESDYIYREQDSLQFGPWVDHLYRDIGQQAAIFGRCGHHGTATSLFMIRHRFIPQFCSEYLMEGPEDVMSRICERKIGRLIDRDPMNYCHYSFGYDLDRPFDANDKVFSLQQISPIELRELEAHGLLSTAGMPAHIKKFSNCGGL